MNRARKSLHALDWMNVRMADMQMALVAFVAIYLTATRHWNPAQVGVVVASQSFATMLAQPCSGAVIDWSNHKKLIGAVSAGCATAGTLLVVLAPSLFLQVLVQVLIGIVVAGLPALIAAISLGIVGKEKLAQRVGRNEMFNHSGKAAMAIVAGLLAVSFGQRWLFYTAFAFGVGAILPKPPEYGYALDRASFAMRLSDRNSLIADEMKTRAFMLVGLVPECKSFRKGIFRSESRHGGRCCSCLTCSPVARLSPLVFEHINLLGRYAFSVPDSVVRGQLRSLRNPADALEDIA